MTVRYSYETSPHEQGPILPRRSGMGWATMIGVWLVVFLLVWTYVQSGQLTPLDDSDTSSQPITPRGELAGDERETIDVFKEASASVVYITSSEFGRDFFSLKPMEIPRGTGSGFVYDRKGHIVTNYHVIQDADRVLITLADHSQWYATSVGSEPDKDIAVLKIEAPSDKLIPIKIGESHNLAVGQKVLAIGNPFGLDQTLTVGVVSALGREILATNGRRIRDVIQTDAAINPGNSGGPLLDSAGRLIGMNTQIASPSGASAGISFAVPVDTIIEIVPDLIRYGRVRKPALGIVPVEDRMARRLGIRGVIILSVAENGGAAKAGLRGTLVDDYGYLRRLGDILVKVGDTPVTSLVELKDALEDYKSGDRVQMTYIRDNRPAAVTVELKYLN